MIITAGTYAVDLDDAHVVAVDVEVEGAEGGGVDDAEAVGLAGDEVERRVLVEAREVVDGAVAEGGGEVDQGGVCDSQ